MNLDRPPHHHEPRYAPQQRMSPQQDDASPAPPPDWTRVVAWALPAFYGRSWVPWLRLTVILAVVATIAASVAILVLV